MKGKASILIAIVLALLTATALFADGTHSMVSVKFVNLPTSAPVGTELRIDGTAAANAHVDIAVTPPTGATIPLTANSDTAGHFSTTFSRLTSVGTYKFVASVGRQSATASISAVSASRFFEDMGAIFHKLDSVVSSVSDKGTRALPNADDADARELSAKTQEFHASIVDTHELLSMLPDDFANYAALVNGSERIHQMEKPRIDQLIEARSRIEPLVTRAQEQVNEISDPNFCASFQTLQRTYASVADALEQMRGIATKIQDPIANKAIADFVKEGGNDSDFSTNRQELAQKATRLVSLGVNMVVQRISKTQEVAATLRSERFARLLNKYCGKIEGPIAGRIMVENYVNGAIWWKYIIRFDGLLSVTLPSNPNTSTGQRVDGFIRGNATNSMFKEDIFLVERLPFGFKCTDRYGIFPPLYTKTQTDPVAEWGKPRSGTPGYFDIPVSGVLHEHSLSLDLGTAEADFDEDFKNQLVVKLIGKGQVQEQTFDFPIEKARYILDMACEHHLELPIEVTSDRMKIHKLYSREVNPNEKVKIVFEGLYDAQSHRGTL